MPLEPLHHRILIMLQGRKVVEDSEDDEAVE